MLTYISPTVKTDGNGYITDLEIKYNPLPANLTLDTYLDAVNFTLYTRLVLFYINFLLYGNVKMRYIVRDSSSCRYNTPLPEITL